MSWPEYEQWLDDEAEFEQRDFQPVPAMTASGASGYEGTPDRAPVEGGPAVRDDRAPSGPAFPKSAGIPSPLGRQNTPRASSPVSSLGDARGVLLRYQRFAGRMADCHPGEPAVARVDGRRACQWCVYGPEEDSLHV